MFQAQGGGVHSANHLYCVMRNQWVKRLSLGELTDDSK